MADVYGANVQIWAEVESEEFEVYGYYLIKGKLTTEHGTHGFGNYTNYYIDGNIVDVVGSLNEDDMIHKDSRGYRVDVIGNTPEEVHQKYREYVRRAEAEFDNNLEEYRNYHEAEIERDYDD